MPTLSAILITQDEERNIERCLESIRHLADEIIVVDSGSTDRTHEICMKYNVRWEHHNWAGFSGQKNYADTLATCDWTMSIDADEAPDAQMQAHIEQLKAGGFQDGCAYVMRRLTNYCGSWIRHCGWYPDAKVRIWKTGTAEWRGDVHEGLSYSFTPKEITLRGDLLHYSYYSVGEHAARQQKYYTLAAREAFQKGRRCSMARVVLEPLWTFVRCYIFKGGFLDGHAGYLVCRLSAHYTMMKYATLREMCLRDTESDTK